MSPHGIPGWAAAAGLLLLPGLALALARYPARVRLVGLGACLGAAVLAVGFGWGAFSPGASPTARAAACVLAAWAVGTFLTAWAWGGGPAPRPASTPIDPLDRGSRP